MPNVLFFDDARGGQPYLAAGFPCTEKAGEFSSIYDPVVFHGGSGASSELRLAPRLSAGNGGLIPVEGDTYVFHDGNPMVTSADLVNRAKLAIENEAWEDLAPASPETFVLAANYQGAPPYTPMNPGADLEITVSSGVAHDIQGLKRKLGDTLTEIDSRRQATDIPDQICRAAVALSRDRQEPYTISPSTSEWADSLQQRLDTPKASSALQADLTTIAFDASLRPNAGHPNRYDDHAHAFLSEDIPVAVDADNHKRCFFQPMVIQDAAAPNGNALALTPLPAGESTRLFHLRGGQRDILYAPHAVLNHDGSDNSSAISARGKDIDAAIALGRSTTVSGSAPGMVTVVANLDGVPSATGTWNKSPDISVQVPRSFLHDGAMLNELAAERQADYPDRSGHTPGPDEDTNAPRGVSPYLQVRMLADAAREHRVPYILKESEYARWQLQDEKDRVTAEPPAKSHYVTTASAWTESRGRPVFEETTHLDSSGGQPSALSKAAHLVFGDVSPIDKAFTEARSQMKDDYETPFSPDYADDLDTAPSLG